MSNLVRMALTVLYLVLSTCLLGTHGLPDGAPTAACKDMTPQHDAPPQTGPAPYTLTVTTIQANTYQVDVTANNVDIPFMGVMLQARAGNAEDALGTWEISSDDLQVIRCAPGDNNAVTHTFNDDKQSISAIWTGNDATKIIATVVQAKQTFWNNIEQPLP